MKTIFHAALSAVLVLGAVPAQAEMLATNSAPSEERARLLRLVQQPEIRARLIGQGLDVSEVEARLAALTDEETTLLAAKFDELPAGGRADALVIAVALAAIYLVIKYVLPYVLIGSGVLLFAKAASTHQAEQ